MGDFNKTVGRPIDLATAKKWAANYRASLKDPNDTRAHFFGTDIIEKILNENPDCVGIRIYYGIDDAGKKQLMLVGTDSKGENLLPPESAGSRDGGGGNTIADASLPCPTYCPLGGGL